MQKTFKGRELEAWQALPDLAFETTATVVACGAMAARDYTPVHHDKAAAISQGLPDMFMNILTTQGICSCYVTDWAGPDAVVTCVKTKLGGPNMPGDTRKIRRKVAATAGDSADIAVVGNNARGNPVTATSPLGIA